jgi:hypothetical protein
VHLIDVRNARRFVKFTKPSSKVRRQLRCAYRPCALLARRSASAHRRGVAGGLVLHIELGTEQDCDSGNPKPRHEPDHRTQRAVGLIEIAEIGGVQENRTDAPPQGRERSQEGCSTSCPLPGRECDASRRWSRRATGSPSIPSRVSPKATLQADRGTRASAEHLKLPRLCRVTGPKWSRRVRLFEVDSARDEQALSGQVVALNRIAQASSQRSERIRRRASAVTRLRSSRSQTDQAGADGHASNTPSPLGTNQ